LEVLVKNALWKDSVQYFQLPITELEFQSLLYIGSVLPDTSETPLHDLFWDWFRDVECFNMETEEITEAIKAKYFGTMETSKAEHFINRSGKESIMSSGRFRCIHCGDSFDLSDEENEDYENGFFMDDPDCCDDCLKNVNYQEYDTYSDTDPGL